MVCKRGLWLDDLYIDHAFPGQGIVRALMAHLVIIALRNRCERFELMALDSDKDAIGFYRKLGTEVFESWRVCRLDEARLPNVTDPSSGGGTAALSLPPLSSMLAPP